MNRGIDAFEIAIALRFHTIFRYYGAAESCQIKQHYIPKAKELQRPHQFLIAWDLIENKPKSKLASQENRHLA